MTLAASIGPLEQMQQLLQRIYELSFDWRVGDFLLTDPVLAAALDAGGRVTEEKLLVHEADGEILVSLYLDHELLARLAPLEALDEQTLADFVVALEGVSHLLYLGWNAAWNRPVSRLEMEIQAEVDKFVSAAFLLADDRRRLPDGLHARLFERVQYAAELNTEEHGRYRRANRCAADYCLGLARCFLRGGRPGLLQELRRFYRLTAHPKLRHMEQVAASA
ncbi:MAG: hypothetical protein PVJ40_06510 [Gammaproteobacteria bacterium]|jgi:hypothetical protein